MLENFTIFITALWAACTVTMFWVHKNSHGLQEKTFYGRDERNKFDGTRQTYTYYLMGNKRKDGAELGICMEIGWGAAIILFVISSSLFIAMLLA